MAQFLFIFLVFANALLGSAANAKFGAAPAPILPERNRAEPPASSCRKLGKQWRGVVVVSSGFSPSEAPRGEAKGPSSAAEANGGGSEIHLENHHRHSSRDKSVAGGGVILGGLATTFLVAVFCYIRATRRRK